MAMLLVAAILQLGIPVADAQFDLCNTTVDVMRVALGEEGVISASGSVNQTRVSCRFNMVACDACLVNFTIVELQLPVCEANVSVLEKLPTCVSGCSHLVMFEPSYSDVTTRFFFSHESTSSMSFTSLSSSIIVMLCHPDGLSMSQSKVTLHYSVQEKKTRVLGSAVGGSSSRQGVLRSPNFPHGYALRGEVYTYVLHNIDPGGGVRLVFDDWDLAPHSRLVFYTNISSHVPMETFFGSGSRPVVLLPGQTLYMIFEPDVGITSRTNNMGFQVSYTFISARMLSLTTARFFEDSDIVDESKVTTDCGLYFKYMAGGNISFSRNHQSPGAMYDCLWVITPHSAFDWVLLRLVNFSLGGEVSLTVRSGITSDSPLVAHITSTENSTFPMTTQFEGRHGFYLRLRGVLSGSDFLSMVFAAFNRVQSGGCARSGEFECMSGHCIDTHLACDGHIHCDDGRDEGITCKLSPAVLSNLPLVCKESEFACANGRRCLPLSAVCDTWLDCQDGSDEYKCVVQTSERPTGGVASGAASGEEVESVTCEAGEQPCHHGRQCVSLSHLCDGRYDCWDRSDEMHCALGFETSLPRAAPWRVVMPLGIALCVLLSLCVLALCIRTFVKQEVSECGSSTRSSSQSRCSHRDICVKYTLGYRPPTGEITGETTPTKDHPREDPGTAWETKAVVSSGIYVDQDGADFTDACRSARSITSETPLTLDLSRSTSGVTAESPMPDSPPSYEEAMRRSPEGATAPNSAAAADSGGNQPSPSMLSPPAYHIPITGKQHFNFSLWPLSSSSSSTPAVGGTTGPGGGGGKHPSRHLEEASVQLLASEFNSSSGTSDVGSTVGLNALSSDDVFCGGSHQRAAAGLLEAATPNQMCHIEIETDGGSIVSGETLSIGTVTTCGSVREGDVSRSTSFRDRSPEGTAAAHCRQLHPRSASLQSVGSGGGAGGARSLERTMSERNGRPPNACHCHCKGHDSRRLAHKRTRCRSASASSAAAAVVDTCPHVSPARPTAECACAVKAELRLHDLCAVRSRTTKGSAACDSNEDECLLGSQPDSPLLDDVDDDDEDDDDEEEEDLSRCRRHRLTYGTTSSSARLTTNAQCLVHENIYCDTVC